MKIRLSRALPGIVLALAVAATNGNKAKAAPPLPDAAQVVENLHQVGAATKLDGHGHVVAVDFGRARRREFDFSQLSALRELRSLKCPRQPITDADLRTFGRLAKLKSLALDETKITDAGLAAIEKLTGLEELLLANTQLSATPASNTCSVCHA